MRKYRSGVPPRNRRRGETRNEDSRRGIGGRGKGGGENSNEEKKGRLLLWPKEKRGKGKIIKGDTSVVNGSLGRTRKAAGGGMVTSKGLAMGWEDRISGRRLR